MKVLDLEGLGYFWTKIKNKFYIKPDTGIPKSDLSSEVQGSLNKADTALQTETDPIFTASPAHGISSEDIIYWDNKQEKLFAVKIIGSMYRTNVSGSGSISIQGNVGQFPVVLEAGTYTVVTDMQSNTNSYGLSVNCGGNTYTLNTTDGHIHDSREITIPANGRWSGTVIGSVAGNSMISVKIEKVADEVTEIALVGITNDYNDLDNKPILTNYFDGAVYDSNTKRINFKNGNVVKAYIDATAFIKDGMVDNVEIEDGKLIITFNTESGKEPIELDITAIFDPSNYYDKSTIDDFLDDKANVADLATVATSGEYSDLINPPTNVSDFTNDAGYLTEHQSLSNYYTKSETDDLLDDKADTSDLATVATTGSYNDLSNKPTIPTVNNSTITIQKNGSTVNSFTLNQSSNKTINISVPTTASDVSALPASTKYGASLSVSIDSTTYVVTAQLKDQDGNNLGTAQTIDLPLESIVVSGSYDSATKKVVLTLKDGSTIDFSIADLVSGLQTEITSTNKLSADLVEDGTTNKVYTATEKTKLSGIASGAEVNVQSDWNVTNTSSDAYIQNKPDLSIYAQSSNLATVATSGSYNDLSDKPTIPTVNNGTLSISGPSGGSTITTDVFHANQSGDSLIAFSPGTNTTINVNSSTRTITIGTTAEPNVQSNWNETDTSSDAYILNKPTIPDITGKADKVTGAVSGNFAALDSNGNLEDSGYSYTDLNELSDQYTPATESSELESGDTYEEAFGKLEKTITDNEYITAQALNDLNTNKQDTLESGTNIKTINGNSVLGSGDLQITRATVDVGTTTTGAAGTQANVTNSGTIYDAVFNFTIPEGESGCYPTITQTAATATLSPQTVNVWGEMSSLTIYLDTPTTGIYNEYIFSFNSGATATTLSLPADVAWVAPVTIEANRHYEFNIVYNNENQAYYGAMISWEWSSSA